jgi:hypothetical protein
VTVEIPISRGLVALVDDDDLERVTAAGPWCAAPNGRTTYAHRRVAGPNGQASTQQLHAFLTGWERTDHRNGDGLDNRRANLRRATHGQNMFNKRLYKNSTSGFKGVSQRKGSGRWAAQIQANGAHEYLGQYATAEDAARAYDARALALFGDFARLNFPQEIPS